MNPQPSAILKLELSFLAKLLNWIEGVARHRVGTFENPPPEVEFVTLMLFIRPMGANSTGPVRYAKVVVFMQMPSGERQEIATAGFLPGREGQQPLDLSAANRRAVLRNPNGEFRTTYDTTPETE